MSCNIGTRAIVLASLVVVGGGLGSCASSNANRASRNASATLSYADPKAVAEELADDILANPRFQRARQAAFARNEEIVIRLEPVTIEGDDFTGNLRQKIDEFLESVKEVFLQRDVGEFSVVEGKLDAFDQQDFSKKYNQSTGETTTGGKAKAVWAMEVVGKRDKRPTAGGGFTYDFVLRVKLFDGTRKTEVYSGSLILSK